MSDYAALLPRCVVLSINLEFDRDLITLACHACGAEQGVDRTLGGESSAAVTLRFVDAHASCWPLVLPAQRHADD